MQSPVRSYRHGNEIDIILPAACIDFASVASEAVGNERLEDQILAHIGLYSVVANEVTHRLIDNRIKSRTTEARNGNRFQTRQDKGLVIGKVVSAVTLGTLRKAQEDSGDDYGRYLKAMDRAIRVLKLASPIRPLFLPLDQPDLIELLNANHLSSLEPLVKRPLHESTARIIPAVRPVTRLSDYRDRRS